MVVGFGDGLIEVVGVKVTGAAVGGLVTVVGMALGVDVGSVFGVSNCRVYLE